jgi:hypothetical protein
MQSTFGSTFIGSDQQKGGEEIIQYESYTSRFGQNVAGPF